MEILKFIIGLILFLIMLYLAYKGVCKIYKIWKDYLSWKELKEYYADSATISFQHFIDLYRVFPNKWRTNETTITYDRDYTHSTSFMWESYSDRMKYLKWVKEKDKREKAEKSRQKTLEVLMEIQKDIEGMMEGEGET